MSTSLASCRIPALPSPTVRTVRGVLVLSVSLIATFMMWLAPPCAYADPPKQGASTATLLAQEAAKPTPGVDAPKVTPHRTAPHRTAQAKSKAKSASAKGAKPGAKPTLAKPVGAKPVSTKPAVKPAAHPKGAKPHAAPKAATKPAGAHI